jgi:proteic killer suppression protein
MDIEFANDDLEEVYYDPKDTIRHGPLVDKGFRKLIGKIHAAKDEVDLRALKGVHYHKLSGNRQHQHALNINDQWRLVIERCEKDGSIYLRIISVEDYH